jgi:hypothetical protein
VKGPNHELETVPDANFIKAVVEPINGKSISVRIYSIEGKASNGTIRLTDIIGIEPNVTEMKFQFINEFEKEIIFALKSKPENEFIVGLLVKGNGSVLNISAHKYQIITDCKIAADGDPKIQSEQSVSIHSAPQPLSIQIFLY